MHKTNKDYKHLIKHGNNQKELQAKQMESEWESKIIQYKGRETWEIQNIPKKNSVEYFKIQKITLKFLKKIV